MKADWPNYEKVDGFGEIGEAIKICTSFWQDGITLTWKEQLGYTEDATLFRSTMERVKEGYNKCWNGYAYRHPSYQESTDDRVQALAVISGIADETKN